MCVGTQPGRSLRSSHEAHNPPGALGKRTLHNLEICAGGRKEAVGSRTNKVSRTGVSLSSGVGMGTFSRSAGPETVEVGWDGDDGLPWRMVRRGQGDEGSRLWECPRGHGVLILN